MEYLEAKIIVVKKKRKIKLLRFLVKKQQKAFEKFAKSIRLNQLRNVVLRKPRKNDVVV